MMFVVRGSVWRKWDLHVHTPESFYHNYELTDGEVYTDIWEKYIDKLEKIQDVSVIGITDYFSIDGYKKIINYQNEGRLQNFDLILPNVEFRLDKFLSNKKDVNPRRLNYHVIFSEKIDPEKIEKEFLEEIPIKIPSGEDRKLNKNHIIEIGRTLREQHEKFKSKSDYVVGCENITVSLDEIKKILEKKRSIFEGKYLLVLPEEKWFSLGWDGQDHLTRKTLLVNSNAIFSSNPNTRDWSLGKEHISQKDFVKEFGSLKPCIHGSDAHSFDKLCKPDEDRFCWIKADPSSEGLKQIIYEPESRVRIQPDNPEPRKNIYTLNTAKIYNSEINDEISIEEQEIPLNHNLVAVIGGKGSGKTALLDLIANCFEDRCYRNGEDKNSFVQRIEEQKPDLKVQLSFIKDDIGKFSKELNEDNFFLDSRITYLPQGKIEEYSGDRTKLDKKIKELIFSNKAVIEGGYKQKFDEINNEIDDINKKIEKISQNIFEMEQDTKQELMSEIEGKKRIKEGELKDKKDKLIKTTENLEGDITEKTEELKNDETNLRIKHSKIEDIKAKLETLEVNLTALLNESNENINNLNNELLELTISLTIPQLELEPQFNAINQLHQSVVSEIEKVKKEIESKQKLLGELSGVEKEHADLLKEIENINDEIKFFQEQLDQINQKRIEITSLEKERLQKYHILLSKYLELQNYYNEVIEKFSKGKNDILSGIEFKSNIYFTSDKFIEYGEDIFHGKKVHYEQIVEIATKLGALFNEKDEKNFEKFIQDIFKLKTFLKKTRSDIDFYKWIFADYFSLVTDIFFNSIQLEKLSMGQKGTILLKLFLAEGDHPLIIDQPEENLDNKFIYDSLVDAFRDAKLKRQIIIATHNANLVVNTDAEQVIISEFKNNKISYISGSIENIGIRKEITAILEGGEEAFKRREQKYGVG